MRFYERFGHYGNGWTLQCVDYIGKDSVWVISSMLPLIALCAVTESARSKTYGMAELEQASRFSLKSVMLARMGIMSFLHFIIFITLIPFVGKKIISISMGNRMLQVHCMRKKEKKKKRKCGFAVI